jgi:MYXO-CTERM domain-containing protein
VRCPMLVLLVCACVSSTARAATWYVDQSAAAGGDGSAAKPFRAIKDVLNVLKTGDTVEIKNGTYSESVNFWHVPTGTAGAKTIIKAAAGATVVIDGGGQDFVIQAGETPNMSFQGLTLRNASEGFIFYTATAGGTPNADGGEVINCKTEKLASSAIEFYHSSNGLVQGSDLQGGVGGKKVTGAVIKGNKIHDASQEGISLHADSKNCKFLGNEVYDNTHVNVYLDSCSNMTVDGNVIYETGTPPDDQSGILLADESYPSEGVTAPVLNNITITNNVIINNFTGIEFWDGAFPNQSALKNVTIANNTVVNSSNVGLSWSKGPHSGSVVRNNIFADQTGGALLLMAKSTTGVTLDHNLWYAPSIVEPFNWGGSMAYTHGAWTGASGQGAGDQLGDPKFAGAWALPAGNLKVVQGSPAIDNGAAVTGCNTDFGGNARPAGTGWDIGAFEYGATGGPDGGPVAGDGAGKKDAGAKTERGLPAVDAYHTERGATPGDASGERGSSSSSGCGCAVSSAPMAGASALLLLVLPLAWRRRRR